MLTKRMQVVFCLQVRLMRFFGCGKQPKSNRLVIDLDFGQPLFVFLANARKTTAVVSTLTILRILGVCRLAQIGNAIVRSVAIDMVKLMRRPFVMNIEPCKLMRGVQNVIKPNTNISVAHAASSFAAYFATTTRFAPRKNARFGVVTNNFTQTKLSYFFGIHGLNNIKQAMWCQA